jgi:hypothetical protein
MVIEINTKNVLIKMEKKKVHIKSGMKMEINVLKVFIKME